MPKVIDAKSWQLTPAADGRRYSKYPDGDVFIPTTPPSVPANFRVTGTTATTISLAWDANPAGEAVTHYEVGGGTGDNSGNEISRNDFVFHDSNIAGLTLTVTGLEEAREHYFRVRAYNAAGVGAYTARLWTETVGVVPVAPPSPGASPTLFQDYSGRAFAGEPGALAVNDDWATTVYDYVPQYAPTIPTIPVPTGAGDEAICTTRTQLTTALGNAAIKKIFVQRGMDIVTTGQIDVTVSGTEVAPRWIVYYDNVAPSSVQNIKPWGRALSERAVLPQLRLDGASWYYIVGLSFGRRRGANQFASRAVSIVGGSTNNVVYRCYSVFGINPIFSATSGATGNVFYQCLTEDSARVSDNVGVNQDVHGFYFGSGDNNRIVTCETIDMLGDGIQVNGGTNCIVEDCDFHMVTRFDGNGNVDPNGNFSAGENAVDLKASSGIKIYGNRAFNYLAADPVAAPGAGRALFQVSNTSARKYQIDIRWNVLHASNKRAIVFNDGSILTGNNGNNSVVRNVVSNFNTDIALYLGFENCETYLNTVNEFAGLSSLVQFFRSNGTNIDHDMMGNLFMNVGGAWSSTARLSAPATVGYNCYAGTAPTYNKIYSVGYTTAVKADLSLGNFSYVRRKLTGPEVATIPGIVPTSATPSAVRSLVPTTGADQIGSRTGLGVDNVY